MSRSRRVLDAIAAAVKGLIAGAGAAMVFLLVMYAVGALARRERADAVYVLTVVVGCAAALYRERQVRRRQARRREAA